MALRPSEMVSQPHEIAAYSNEIATSASCLTVWLVTAVWNSPLPQTRPQRSAAVADPMMIGFRSNRFGLGKTILVESYGMSFGYINRTPRVGLHFDVPNIYPNHAQPSSPTEPHDTSLSHTKPMPRPHPTPEPYGAPWGSISLYKAAAQTR